MILPASIYGRTEPQCDIGHTGEKNLQAMQLRVATSIELLKGVVQVSNRVLPRFRLYNHTLLLKTLADAIFQLELVGDYIRLLPLPRVPQTFPDIQHAPGTPPMDAGHPLHSRTT